MIQEKLFCDGCGKEIEFWQARYELWRNDHGVKSGRQDYCHDCMLLINELHRARKALRRSGD